MDAFRFTPFNDARCQASAQKFVDQWMPALPATLQYTQARFLCGGCGHYHEITLTRRANVVVPLVHSKRTRTFHLSTCKRVPPVTEPYRPGAMLQTCIADALLDETTPQPCKWCLWRDVRKYLGVRL